MPIYDFRCTSCAQQIEVTQSMNASSPICQRCDIDMERWISCAPAVHGAVALGREQAARSLPQCGKGCRCCP